MRDGSRTAAAQALEFPVGGMTCANCSARVERALRAQPGVAEASVVRVNSHDCEPRVVSLRFDQRFAGILEM